MSDWPDVLQLELDYLISAEISERGREPDQLGFRFPWWKGFMFTSWTFSAHSQKNLTAAGTSNGLDRHVENTKEETEVIHDIIKA